MSDILAALGAWPLLPMALAVWGFAPGLVNRMISWGFPRTDPRRAEMIAELYTVPRWERPFWVAEQAERLLTEGLPARLAHLIDQRFVHRWRLGDGMKMHERYPSTFQVPPNGTVHLWRGDRVKLMFDIPRAPNGEPGSERLWVEVSGDYFGRYRGRLLNVPLYAGGLRPGKHIWFSARHVIDIVPSRLVEGTSVEDYQPDGDDRHANRLYFHWGD